MAHHLNPNDDKYSSPKKKMFPGANQHINHSHSVFNNEYPYGKYTGSTRQYRDPNDQVASKITQPMLQYRSQEAMIARNQQMHASKSQIPPLSSVYQYQSRQRSSDLANAGIRALNNNQKSQQIHQQITQMDNQIQEQRLKSQQNQSLAVDYAYNKNYATIEASNPESKSERLEQLVSQQKLDLQPSPQVQQMNMVDGDNDYLQKELDKLPATKINPQMQSIVPNSMPQTQINSQLDHYQPQLNQQQVRQPSYSGQASPLIQGPVQSNLTQSVNAPSSSQKMIDIQLKQQDTDPFILNAQRYKFRQQQALEKQNMIYNMHMSNVTTPMQSRKHQLITDEKRREITKEQLTKQMEDQQTKYQSDMKNNYLHTLQQQMQEKQQTQLMEQQKKKQNTLVNQQKESLQRQQDQQLQIERLRDQQNYRSMLDQQQLLNRHAKQQNDAYLNNRRI